MIDFALFHLVQEPIVVTESLDDSKMPPDQAPVYILSGGLVFFSAFCIANN